MKIAVLCDAFPELSETFVTGEVAALRRQGHDVRVVCLSHPRHEHWPDGERERVHLTVVADLGRRAKIPAMTRLAFTRPRACARDVRTRPAWRPAERPHRLAALAPVAVALRTWGVEHLHVHFAAGAAMEGLRLGDILGVPVSITAHAHDIFRTPRNLERKLTHAAFVTSGCAYNVDHLRSVVAAPTAVRIHEIVMGVDAAAFRRTRPHPTDGRVLAVGRLVEKKGFADLVRACALLRDEPAFTGLTIVGEGPLEGELRALVASLGLEAHVTLLGALAPAAVRGQLEGASVLAMPCVVASDGDRDSMPVVVKEALAMEVPVVATDEVGLPEIVDATCGRLVAPGDPRALAAALGDLLRAGPQERAALGQAGRARVLERCDVDAETRRLVALITTARRRRSRRTGARTGSDDPPSA